VRKWFRFTRGHRSHSVTCEAGPVPVLLLKVQHERRGTAFAGAE